MCLRNGPICGCLGVWHLWGPNPRLFRTGALSQRLRPLGQTVLGPSNPRRRPQTQEAWGAQKAAPGIEPGTFRTRSENHAIRPSSHPESTSARHNDVTNEGVARLVGPCGRGPWFKQLAGKVGGLRAFTETMNKCGRAGAAQIRRRGGIEPLRLSTPLELKSSPGTSPTHPG